MTKTGGSLTARISFVLELIIAGLHRRQILDTVKSKHPEWLIRTRQVDRYIASASEILRAESQILRPMEIGKALRRLNMLFARCLQDADFVGALRVEQSRIDLLGLEAPPPDTRIQVDGLQIDGRQQAINLFASSPEAAQHMIALAHLMEPGEQVMGHPEQTPGNLAHVANPPVGVIHNTPKPAQGGPVEAKSKPKAPKRRKPKKSAPQAEEIEIDDSDAQPMEAKPSPSLMDAFLPKRE